MKNEYDVVVIGGGHNGLVTATQLATKMKVLLVEQRDTVGGLAAPVAFGEFRGEGVLQDTSEFREEVIRQLQLEKHGLRYQRKRPSCTLVARSGETIDLDGDTEKAAASIAKISQHDADAYRQYRAFIDKISGFIQGLMNQAPPDLFNAGTGELWKLAKKGLALKRLGRATMMELLKVAPMSVADYLNELFETDFLKAGIAAPAIYGSLTGPWSSYTTLNLLIRECMSNITIEGGGGALVDALERAATASGVEIRTGVSVSQIVLDENGAVSGVELSNGENVQARAVSASCTPHTTFFDLLKPNMVDYSLEHGIEYFRSRGTTAKVYLALSDQPVFNGVAAHSLRTGNSFDEMEQAFDHVKYQEMSSDPILDIQMVDNVASILVHFAPYDLKGGWNEASKKQLYSNTLGVMEQYTPGISDLITAHHVMVPADLEAQYSLFNGHVLHGEHAVDQLITRPIPMCSGYSTPIKGLFLSGSGSHPGGGLTGMPGLLSANVVLNKG